MLLCHYLSQRQHNTRYFQVHRARATMISREITDKDFISHINSPCWNIFRVGSVTSTPLMRMLLMYYFMKNKIIRVKPDFIQMGTLHIPNAALKERDGRYKTFRALRNFYDQNRFLLHGIHSCEIRFKRIFSCYGVNRQRQERYPESSVCKFPFYCKNPLKSKRI